MIWQSLVALTGLVTVGIPVLIHLLGRRQARRQKFPTLRFLDPSRLLPTRRTRLTDLPLLLVRCAIVTVAALALAQPLFITARRAAALRDTIARAIVVDTSASMRRPAGLAPGGSERAVDVARGEAKRLATEAASSLVLETAFPSDAVAGAVDWLGHQPGRAELVVVSDFQVGTVDTTTLGSVPRSMGVTLVRVPVRRDSVLTLAARTGQGIIDARVVLATDRTAVEWRALGSQPDSTSRAPTLLAAERDRAAAAAAARAARSLGTPWEGKQDRQIIVVFPGYERRAQLIQNAKPMSQPWMADAVVRLRADGFLSDSLAAIEGVERGSPALLVFPGTDPGTLASAAFIASAAHATVAPLDGAELDPTSVSPEQLRQWERPAPNTPRPHAGPVNGESDGRWLWGVVLALLALESWVRRARPKADHIDPVAGVARDRAA